LAGGASSHASALRALQARPVTATRAAPPVSGSAISLVMSTFGAGKRS
jgi:hypothetical protein